jgi:hemoglobin-like flavoprotein
MGAALMATLAETLGKEFTPELEAAWNAAYDHFAALMIARGGFT